MEQALDLKQLNNTTMTKQDVLNLYQALNSLGGLKGAKFGYAVAKNIGVIKPEIEAIEKANQLSEEIQAFEKQRVELVEKFAKHDKDGKAVINNNAYEMEDQKGFDKAYAKLREDNKEVVEKREQQVTDFLSLLKTDSTVSLHKVKLSDIPADITAAQMNGINLIVDEV